MANGTPFGQDADTRLADANKAIRNGGLLAGAGLLITLITAAIGQTVFFTPVLILTGLLFIGWGFWQRSKAQS